MNVGSAAFFLFAAAAVVVWYRLPARTRPFGLLGINLLFAASLLLSSPLSALPIMGFVAIGWLLLHLLAGARGRAALPLSLILLIALFVAIKRYSVVADLVPLDFVYATVGLSYVLFRTLHLAVDVRQGAIRPVPGLVDYLNYLFFFPAFVSGPIQRYGDHRRDLAQAAAAPDPGDVPAACARILAGIVKVSVVATVASELAEGLPLPLDAAPGGAGTLRLGLLFALRAAAFLAYLYVNFDGYMDIVIGIGRLCGFHLPENFNRPFAARNFVEFWSRWHITLSDWFKTYLFNPLLMQLAKRWGRGKASAYLAVPAFFVTFMVMGLWHGTTPAFWIYGLLLGAGVSLNRLYQVLAQHRLGKAGYRALAANPVYAEASRGLMVAYFAASLACLWLDAAQLARLVALLGPGGLLALLLLGAAAAAVAMSAWDAAARLAAPAPALVAAVGLLYLAMVWTNPPQWRDALGGLTAFDLSEARQAIPGAILLALGLAAETPAGTRRAAPPTIGVASMGARAVLLLLVAFSHVGAVPDFVYKGF